MFFEELEELEREAEKQDSSFEVLIPKLKKNCQNCSLALTNPNNKGFYDVGKPTARYCLLGESPVLGSDSSYSAFSQQDLMELKKWLGIMNIDENDVYYTNIVQCTPPKNDKGETDLRKKDIETCFPNRALQVLRSMPNLEVVITLGWTTVASVLGIPSAGQSTHEGQWFGTSRLPGVAIFSLPHPSQYPANLSWEHRGRLRQLLVLFEQEKTRVPQAIKNQE